MLFAYRLNRLNDYSECIKVYDNEEYNQAVIDFKNYQVKSQNEIIRLELVDNDIMDPICFEGLGLLNKYYEEGLEFMEEIY